MAATSGRVRVFDHDVIAEDKDIDTGAEEASDGIFGGIHDWLAHDVEGGVYDDGNAAELLEFGDHFIVARIDFLIDGLDACGSVDVGDGGKEGAFVFNDGIYKEHKR
jgi:hypothetical protein